MGKSWKNPIMAANAAKKGAKFTKLAREIQVAAKLGGADPQSNSRLRMAIDAAREASCPKDTIERAVKKGAGLLNDGQTLEEVTYEGFAPHQVGVLVECQTDNRNRTASEIKNLFNKRGGQIGEPGSVAWLFDRVSLVEAEAPKSVTDSEAEAIEVGAEDVESVTPPLYRFYGRPTDLKSIENSLEQRSWKVKLAELSFRAKMIKTLSTQQLTELYEFIEALDDNDDTHRIHVDVDL